MKAVIKCKEDRRFGDAFCCRISIGKSEIKINIKRRGKRNGLRDLIEFSRSNPQKLNLMDLWIPIRLSLDEHNRWMERKLCRCLCGFFIENEPGDARNEGEWKEHAARSSYWVGSGSQTGTTNESAGRHWQEDVHIYGLFEPNRA